MQKTLESGTTVKPALANAKTALACLAAVLFCGTPFVSRAATTTGPLEVTATIANSCAFHTSTVPFGAYDPVGANASTPLAKTGDIHLTCTSGASVTLRANEGLHAANATGTCATATCTRAMKSGTNYLSYDLYTNAGHSTLWNNTTSIPVTGTGAEQRIDVFGYIPAGSVQPAGSYADTVTMTATY